MVKGVPHFSDPPVVGKAQLTQEERRRTYLHSASYACRRPPSGWSSSMDPGARRRKQTNGESRFVLVSPPRARSRVTPSRSL